jgi:hypothetical protein
MERPFLKLWEFEDEDENEDELITGRKIICYLFAAA